MSEQAPPRIIDRRYFAAYLEAVSEDQAPQAGWRAFMQQPKLPPVRYAFQASAVYSANIEGNTMDLNSYLRSKMRGGPHPKAKEQTEIDALVDAYAFARRRVPSERNALEAHRLLARELLPETQRGVYRTGRMFVYDSRGILYAAVEAEHVAGLMRTFFDDLTALRRQSLNVNEAFYYAGLLHLVFVHIHPFEDGNGRMARLLKKWFLAAHLGSKAGKIPSEEYYWRNRPTYYEAIRLGPTYYDLDYERCIPFLTLLSQALTIS